MKNKTKPTLRYESISDQFSFKISPTMVTILKVQGQVTVLLDDEEFVIIKESELAQVEAKAGKDERQRVIEEVEEMIEGMKKLDADFQAIPRDLTMDSLEKASQAVSHHGYNKALDDLLQELNKLK